jgi:predicted Zn-dependent protease
MRISPNPVAGRRLTLPVLGALAALLLLRCATNPATGQRQLMLYSESQEIALGRNADEDIVRNYGLYPDEELQAYVQELGTRLARSSERPELPWTFRVLDDPVVNAFALPGGYIYVTRGILGHLGSEAELAGVIGHEIGHVTARHGVNRLSKAQLAQLGLGVGMVLAPELEGWSGLASTSLQLLFLKYGRDDERQADDLGFRYMSRGGYPPEALTEVFTVLQQVGESSGRSPLPNWLSTHPAPESRRVRVAERLDELPPALSDAPWHRPEYLGRLEGLVFGVNPRQGFFRGDLFYHPDLRFQLRFPAGWTTRNQRDAVVAASPEQDAVVVLTLAEEGDPRSAEAAFFEQSGVEAGGRWLDFRSTAGESRYFRVVTDEGTAEERTLLGGAAFLEHGGRVFRLLAYSRDDAWDGRRQAMTGWAASFEPLTDPEILNVEPMRIELVTLDRATTLEDFDRRHPSSIDLEQLAVLNHCRPATRLEAGRVVKRVVGFNPDR